MKAMAKKARRECPVSKSGKHKYQKFTERSQGFVTVKGDFGKTCTECGKHVKPLKKK